MKLEKGQENKMNWGTQTVVEDNPYFELHRLFVQSGKACTIHLHKHKRDIWFVESGSISIKIFDGGNNLISENIVNAGEKFILNPGVIHQFEGIQDSVVLEYFYTPHDKNDKVVVKDRYVQH